MGDERPVETTLIEDSYKGGVDEGMVAGRGRPRR